MRLFVLSLMVCGFLASGISTAQTLIDIPGGTFVMGDAKGDANEAPKTVSVAPFRLMRLEVTNNQFAAFSRATGYITDREKEGWGWVWPGGRWTRVNGADWKHPQGPDSSITQLGNHPVVQVSANDAEQYCRWQNMRLPSEMEWEFAARGTDGRRYPWGDARPTQSKPHRTNLGRIKCCAPDDADGYLRTSPVGKFPANASPFGVLDMAGNVWEWTYDRFPGVPYERAIRGGGWGNNPYCLRVSYRHGNRPHYGLDMVGFRCAADKE